MNFLELNMIVTNGQYIGKQIHMPFSNMTTFNELYSFLLKELGEKHIKLHVEETRTMSLCNHVLNIIGQEPICQSLMISNTLPLSVSDYKPEITLRLSGCPNAPSLLKIHLSDTVGILKMILESHSKLPSSKMEITANEDNGNLLDGSTLTEAGICDFAEVRVNISLKGGSKASGSLVGFVDVFQDSAIKEGAWDLAPRWRACDEGLNTEGLCKKRGCIARKRYVVANHRFGSFDLCHMVSSCPMCHSSISLENIYFSSCFYSIQGKSIDLKALEKKTTWNKVGDYWRTWDAKSAGKKDWLYLRVITRPLSRAYRVETSSFTGEVPVSDECAICFKEISPPFDIRVPDCFHCYHKNCWDSWAEMKKSDSDRANCPLC